MNLIERGIAAVCVVVMWITTTVIFAILVANAVLRYATGGSLEWASEVPELMFPWLVMSGVVLAAMHGSHIATTFLLEAIPARWQRRVAIAGWLVVGALYGVLAWATAGMLAIVHDEHSPVLGVPGSTTYGCVLIGMAMLSVLAFRSAHRAWVGNGSARPGGEHQPHLTTT